MQFLDRAIPKRDLATGIGTSILVHVLIFGSAIFAALLIPQKPMPTPYCSVDLVSIKNIGEGMAEPKGELNGARKAATEKAQHHAAARRKAGPVVRVRRLAVRQPVEKIETHIKQMEPKDAPVVPKRTQGVESIDKNLDKLIARPKLPKHNRPPVENARSERSSGERSASVAANEDRGQGRAPLGTPNGTARGGRRGTGPGSAFGNPNGSAAAMQILGMYGQMVKEKIQREWSLANDRGVNGLRTVLAVQITRTGQIVSVVVRMSSGNELFDEAAVRAVNRSGPLPPVPAAAQGNVPQFILTFMPGKVS